MRVCGLLVVLALASAHGLDRNLTSKINPGCPDCSNTTTLVYVRADGPEDTIHHIWDFTRNIPTLIFAVGQLNSSVNFKWDNTRPIEISMPEKPRYSFAMALDKLYEYDDLHDTGRYDPSYPKRQFSMRSISWVLKEGKLEDSEVTVCMQGAVNGNNDERNAFMQVSLNVIPTVGYSARLPHLIHNANTTLVDVSLVNLTTSSSFNASRYALHYVLLSAESGPTENDTMQYTVRKSLDDEHTPGVFEIMEVTSPGSALGSAGGFVQFRPVGYTRRARNVDTSTAAHVAGFNRTSIPRHSTLSLFYDSYDPSHLLLEDMIISFGVAGDGFYKKNNYTAWSYTAGWGAPPAERFSGLVVGVVAGGLAVPAACSLAGLAYLLVRRARQRHHHAPTRFTEED